jgi:hypothetical protein
MIFLIFFTTFRKCFPPKIKGKHFPLTGKCFSLTNFPNDKQRHESLESGFQEITFRANKHPFNLYF